MAAADSTHPLRHEGLLNLTCTVDQITHTIVPLDKEAKVTDDTRIRAALPTIKYLVVRIARSDRPL